LTDIHPRKKRPYSKPVLRRLDPEAVLAKLMKLAEEGDTEAVRLLEICSMPLVEDDSGHRNPRDDTAP